MSSNKERNLLSWGIVLGVITGAIAMFFLAPKSGDETKKILAKKLNSVSQKTISKTQDVLLDFEAALAKDKTLENDEIYY